MGQKLYIGKIAQVVFLWLRIKKLHLESKIDIIVFILQEKFENVLFVPKYENYRVMLADMCTKPCLGPIIIMSTKGMNGFC